MSSTKLAYKGPPNPVLIDLTIGNDLVAKIIAEVNLAVLMESYGELPPGACMVTPNGSETNKKLVCRLWCDIFSSLCLRY